MKPTALALLPFDNIQHPANNPSEEPSTWFALLETIVWRRPLISRFLDNLRCAHISLFPRYAIKSGVARGNVASERVGSVKMAC